MMTGIISGIGGIFLTLINVYMWVVIIGALLSWVRPDPYNPIVQIIYRLTEPAYRLVRKVMPTVFNGLDLAPLILIILLQVIEVILANVLRGLVIS
jgi:YggT family protein